MWPTNTFLKRTKSKRVEQKTLENFRNFFKLLSIFFLDSASTLKRRIRKFVVTNTNKRLALMILPWMFLKSKQQVFTRILLDL